MFLCFELMSSTRLAALSTCWGKNNLQIPTFRREECWWGAESKNTERQDIITLAKCSSHQGTERKRWAGPLGKDNPGRYPRVCGHGDGPGKFLGELRRALSASVSEHPQCPLSSRTTHGKSRGLIGWLYRILRGSLSREQGWVWWTMSVAFVSANKCQAEMWHLKSFMGRKMKGLYFWLYGNEHCSFLI